MSFVFQGIKRDFCGSGLLPARSLHCSSSAIVWPTFVFLLDSILMANLNWTSFHSFYPPLLLLLLLLSSTAPLLRYLNSTPMALVRYVRSLHILCFILKEDIKCNDDSGGRWFLSSSLSKSSNRVCLFLCERRGGEEDAEEELLKLCEENRVLVIRDG